MNHPMKTTDPSVKPEHLACAVCMKDIPLSEAIIPEATDYVVHFCSPDCYEKWRQQEDPAPSQKPA